MYYKCILDGRSPAVPDWLQLKYAPGMWTHPIIGKLFVFNSLESAIRFVEIFGGALYVCKVTNPQFAPKKIPSNVASEREITEFWKTGALPVKQHTSCTRLITLADSVMLTDLILEIK